MRSLSKHHSVWVLSITKEKFSAHITTQLRNSFETWQHLIINFLLVCLALITDCVLLQRERESKMTIAPYTYLVTVLEYVCSLSLLAFLSYCYSLKVLIIDIIWYRHFTDVNLGLCGNNIALVHSSQWNTIQLERA